MEEFDLNIILNDMNIKKIQARNMIVEAITKGVLSFEEIEEEARTLKDKKVSTILEAIEEVSNKSLIDLDVKYLDLAKRYINSEDNSCKREAARIIGNLASLYPESVGNCIEALISNANDKGTVVRWSSAYALSRIMLLANYRDSDMITRIKAVYEAEKDNGVRNQYVKAFKKIKH